MDDTIIEYVVKEDGRIELEGLPVHRGDRIQVTIQAQTARKDRKPISEILKMDAIGMWADREDIGDSEAYARRLRKQAETRDWSLDDPARQ